MIVLPETNVWVSALRFGGVPLESVRLAIAKDIVLTCDELENEISRTLVRWFGFSKETIRGQMDAMLQAAVRIGISGQITGVCRDPKDDYLLECAVLGGADAIVTGDKDLLSLVQYEGVRMMTPRQYLDEARDR